MVLAKYSLFKASDASAQAISDKFNGGFKTDNIALRGHPGEKILRILVRSPEGPSTQSVWSLVGYLDLLGSFLQLQRAFDYPLRLSR